LGTCRACHIIENKTEEREQASASGRRDKVSTREVKIFDEGDNNSTLTIRKQQKQNKIR
jgi:hypothetical protein